MYFAISHHQILDSSRIHRFYCGHKVNSCMVAVPARQATRAGTGRAGRYTTTLCRSWLTVIHQSWIYEIGYNRWQVLRTFGAKRLQINCPSDTTFCLHRRGLNMSTGEPDARLRRIVQVSGPPLLSGPSTHLLDDKIDLLKAGLRTWILSLNELCGYGSQIQHLIIFLCILSSVTDPGPEDSDVFGHPGSRSISTRYGSGSRSFYNQAKI